MCTCLVVYTPSAWGHTSRQWQCAVLSTRSVVTVGWALSVGTWFAPCCHFLCKFVHTYISHVISLHICRLPHITTPCFSIRSWRAGACLLQFQPQSDCCVHFHRSLINFFLLAALVKLSFNRTYWSSAGSGSYSMIQIQIAVTTVCLFTFRRLRGGVLPALPSPSLYTHLWLICSACYPLKQTLSEQIEGINLWSKSVVLPRTPSTHRGCLALDTHRVCFL